MKQRGFTIIEVLVVMAIIAMIAGTSFLSYRAAFVQSKTDLTVNTIAFSLRRAQILSQAVDGDSQWGVRIINNQVTIFKGASYATRIQASDNIANIPSTSVITGLTEMVFSKMTGLPAAVGSIVVTGANNASKTITVNAKGTVSY